MDSIQILLLALIQGITEFLPISSSAHLILAPYLFGYEDQGLAFDVAVHLGSLLAVVYYFRQQIIDITRDWFKSLRQQKHNTQNAKMGWYIIVATIPVVIVGGLFAGLVSTTLRSPSVIAVTTIVFGLLLWWADQRGKGQRQLKQLSWRDVLIIGLMQAIAIIPGTSRSGITMTAALMLGFDRQSASRFSFLIAIPTIAMSSLYMIAKLMTSSHSIDWFTLAAGVIFSAMAALLSITYFLRFIERIGMLPFVIYRLLLGLILILLIVYG